MRHLAAPVAARDPGVAQIAATGDPDPEQAPERARRDEVVQRARLAAEAVVLRDHRDPPGARRGVGDRHGVRERQRERLLDDDMTPGCERELRERPVGRGRRGEHDDVRLHCGERTAEIAEGGNSERLLGPFAGRARRHRRRRRGGSRARARCAPPSCAPTARRRRGRREAGSSAQLSGDGEIRVVAALERGEVDPLVDAVEPADDRPEDDGRDARVGEQGGVGPERDAADLRRDRGAGAMPPRRPRRRTSRTGRD